MEKKSLGSLHGSPLPADNIGVVDASFETIWMVMAIAFTFLFGRYVSNPPRTWPEFRTLQYGTACASMWYFGNVVDRWLHYDQRTVGFGYVAFLPIMEFFYVASNALILWGTYSIVWKELEACRFQEIYLRIWFAVGKITLFLVCLLSLYYAVLYLALAIVWAKFLSLDIIQDIATKRTQFEVSMTAFYFIYSLITFGAASVAIIWGSKRTEGKIRKTRLVLWVATLLLLARSMAQFGIIVNIDRTKATRQARILTKDITFGLLTLLFLISMLFVAWKLSEPLDKGGNDAGVIRSDVRKYILNWLKKETKQGRQQAPSFEEVLANATENIETILDEGPLSTSLQMDRDHKREIANEHIEVLREKYGALNPKEGREFNNAASRRGSPFSSILGGRRSTPFSRRSVSNPGGSLYSPTPMSNSSRQPFMTFSPSPVSER